MDDFNPKNVLVVSIAVGVTLIAVMLILAVPIYRAVRGDQEVRKAVQLRIVDSCQGTPDPAYCVYQTGNAVTEAAR